MDPWVDDGCGVDVDDTGPLPDAVSLSTNPTTDETGASIPEVDRPITRQAPARRRS
jgi:hypothetical protein